MIKKLLVTIGKDLWSGSKTLLLIASIMTGVLSVFMSVDSLLQEKEIIPGYMHIVYTLAGIAILAFYWFIPRGIAQEAFKNWNASLNVKHFVCVFLTTAGIAFFVGFLIVSTVGIATLVDNWLAKDMTLGQIWDEKSLFENISMWFGMLIFAVFFSTPFISYIAGVVERMKKDN